jgi:hypothetical protein
VRTLQGMSLNTLGWLNNGIITERARQEGSRFPMEKWKARNTRFWGIVTHYKGFKRLGQYILWRLRKVQTYADERGHSDDAGGKPTSLFELPPMQKLEFNIPCQYAVVVRKYNCDIEHFGCAGWGINQQQRRNGTQCE